MKIFNANNTTKNSKGWVWMRMLLIGIISLSIISCDEDDDDMVDMEPEVQEVESAWVTGYFVGTPQGRVWYLRVDEEVPTEFDASEAVELGFNQRMYSFGENPYVWDSDARTMTKWEVDKTDLSLSPAAIMSLASTGYQSFVAYPAFISETQAFVTNLTEGLIIEWNPSDMTITEVHQVEPLMSIHEGASVNEFFNYVKGNKIFMPIGQDGPPNCCDINTSNMGATVAVFDVNTKTLEYVKDDRLMSSVFRFVSDESGSFYVQPIDENSWISEYFDFEPSDTPSPHTVLKFNDDGTFDPSFQLNLDEVLDIEVYSEAVLVADNKIVFNYYDSNDGQLAPSYEDSRSLFDEVSARTVAVDLTTGEVTDFTALSKYDFIIIYNTIDGVNYYVAFTSEVTAFDTSYIVRQDAIDSYTELGTYSNVAAQWVGKLW
ncbi:MAG: hypothetical protein AAGA10_14835 [Bacteroidota bacterium]